MTLYKYLTVKKADEWLIGENSILLTPPIYLNDFLEFRVCREPPDMEERRAMFEEIQRNAHGSLTFEEYDSSITRKEFMNGEPEDMRKMLSKTLGVVSFSSDPLNELMWAHYGLNDGVAVGYQSSSVSEHEGRRLSIFPLGIAIEVHYSNDVTPMKKDFSDVAHQLTKKRKCWAYEAEWRIVQNLNEASPVTRDAKTYFALPAKRECITHVVFGANAEQNFIERVRNWLADGPANLQKIDNNNNSHELELTDFRNT